MKITTLEELLLTVAPDITVFDEKGELTSEAEIAYDKLVSILGFLQEHNIIANKNVVDKFDRWSEIVIASEYI